MTSGATKKGLSAPDRLLVRKLESAKAGATSIASAPELAKRLLSLKKPQAIKA